MYAIADIGESQNVEDQYHGYRFLKRNGNYFRLSKIRSLIVDDLENQAQRMRFSRQTNIIYNHCSTLNIFLFPSAS